MYRDRNWTRPERKNNRHPAGLKGKDIGLYYKNKNKGPKKETEFVVNLTIPKQVTNQLSKNIQTIVNKANKQGIPIRFDKTTNSVKTILESPTPKKKIQNDSESEMDTSESKFKTPSVYSGHGSKSRNEDVKEELSSKSIKNVDSKYPENVNSTPDFIAIKQESESDCDNSEPILSLRGAGDFKYGYQDIITGSFQEKLDESLSSGITIIKQNNEINDLSCALREEYKDMVTRPKFNKIMDFRKTLPTYKKSKELLEIIEKNQVIVISGETGCGKSTQVPQLILDDAINNNKGANVKILVTQPRRIAASSLATRVADERAERVGNSVGYAVRLEKVDSRPRGSIMYVTTGILLADLEVNQGLVSYSHVILDEVHERDCHVDLAMCMLKQVLKKRKDLKLILMSATLDAEHLSIYFDNCPMMHIEGLAYPVKDYFLEEILEMTKFRLPPPQIKGTRNQPKWMKYRNKKTGFGDPDAMEKDIQYKAEISPWLESIKRKIDYNVYKTLQDSRIEELNIDLMLEVLIHICKGPPGAILVFLPGIGDITKLLRKMEESNIFPKACYEIYPLHSKLPSLEQHKIFERPPRNMRKIIIATNIAETSITIDDIVYVVDCGRIKINGLNIEQNVSTLKNEWVSIANLRQRRGRAGRCQAGVCYHLLTTYRARSLADKLLPELQRSNLLEPVLTIKRLRLGMAEVALNMVPDPPSNLTILSAVKHLQQCGALDDKETLTPLGWHLARLPVHPAAGKLVLLGALFGCLDRAVSVAAVWGFKDPFQLVIGKEKEVDECKRDLALGEPSDHIAVSEAIIEWENLPYSQKRTYAYDNFLSMSTLQLLSEMKKQLGNNLKQMGFLPSGNVKAEWENRNKGNFSLFKTLVAAALYPNIATVRWLNHKWHNPRKPIRLIARTPEDGRILIHPSSVMSTSRGPSSQLQCNAGANWLVYWLKQRSSDLFLFDVTLVYTLPLLFFGELRISQAEDSKSDECLILISTVKVRCKKETVDLLLELRGLLDQVLASKIMASSDHSTVRSPFEEEVLNAVINLITAEDEQADMMGDDEQSGSDQSEGESSRKRWHH